MGDDTFMLACPTVPAVRGSEVRFSVNEPKRVITPGTWPLHFLRRAPLAFLSCGELTPPQERTQWGVNTSGARYDSYSGLQIGSDQNNLTLGRRTTYASGDSRLGPVERQRVGVAS